MKIKSPLPEIVKQARAASGRLQDDMRIVLERVGVKLVSLAQLAYREKARGGTGSDGISWKELSRATLENRVRRRAPARKIVQQRRELAAKAKQSREKTQQQLRRRRKELLARLEELIDREVARHEIGVDTGMQRSSAAPGFTDPAGIWARPADGKGTNVFQIEQSRVTVGYNRSYSEYFDEIRKLFPDTMPAAWLTQLDDIISEWAENIMQEEMG